MPFGIYQIVSKGHVRPVLIFANRAPDYRARFRFPELVERVVREKFHDEMRRALLETIG